MATGSYLTPIYSRSQKIDHKRPEWANMRRAVFHQINSRPHTFIMTPEGWLGIFDAPIILYVLGTKRLPWFSCIAKLS
ncbi:hypothetical protein TNCV_400481 [Trichonephila clavipes]|nr:hypothetical protein TNCV_400481 [Trichonephila clavipes]